MATDVLGELFHRRVAALRLLAERHEHNVVEIASQALTELCRRALSHHGDLDYLLFFSLLTPGNPTNPTGQPVFQKQGGQIVRLLPEEGGPDVATSFWQKVQAEYSRCQTITANPSAYAQDLVAQCALGISLVDHYVLAFYVGLPGGKYSGNDQCVMRYFWANAYPSIADSTTYYKVQNGTEPVGSTICNSLAGTGVNDPNRNLPKDHPQPRYFDATRGDCQHQVCVNDKNAPAKD